MTKIGLDLDNDTNMLNMKCLGMIVLTCINQHLTNIFSLISEKFSSTEAELIKSFAYKKVAT